MQNIKNKQIIDKDYIKLIKNLFYKIYINFVISPFVL